MLLSNFVQPLILSYSRRHIDAITQMSDFDVQIGKRVTYATALFGYILAVRVRSDTYWTFR